MEYKSEKEEGWIVCTHCNYKSQDFELEKLLKSYRSKI